MWSEIRDGELKDIKKMSEQECRRLTAMWRDTAGNATGNRRPTEQAALELEARHETRA